MTDSVTPPLNTPTFLPDNQRVLVNENGVQINMFGSLEQTEKLLITIPLTKIKMKTRLGRIPKKSSVSSTFDSNPLFPESNQNPPKRALLATPLPHTKLTPEDFQRMETMPHEYWEAPELSKPQPPDLSTSHPPELSRPHPPELSRPYPPELSRPHPPSGPQWRPPAEQSYRGRSSYPPQNKQPFYRSPMPPHQPPPEQQQSWSPPRQWPVGNRMESGVNRAPNVGTGKWNQNVPPRPDPNAAGRYSKPSGMESRPSGIDPRPGGMDPRAGGMDPRPGGIESRPSGMESRPGGIDHRPGGMDPRPGGIDPRPGGMDPRPGGMESRPSGMDPRPGGIDPRPSGMDPRHANNDPRHLISDPRSSVRHDPRNSSSQSYHGQRMRWGQSANMEPRQSANMEPRQSANMEPRPVQSSPPYAGQHSMSPPVNYGKQGWSDKISPNWNVDRVSPVWSSSPDHSSSSKAGDDATKRVDPRKKYSHLKIKSKNSPIQSSSNKDNLYSAEPTTSSGPGFKIPKLLTNSTGLDKPFDPKELFGSDGVESQPYGEITFGTYNSPFGQSSEVKGNTDSKTVANNHATTADTHEAKPDTTRGQEVTVPSYFAQIESELGGGGLEIESAFGSLPEKNRQTQESQARKLPSVFGFGL